MQRFTWMPSDERLGVLQGTLDLIVLRTLESLGPRHAYAIATRLQQVSGDLLHLNQGTLYPALVRLEQQGRIKGTWAKTESNREASFTRSPRPGRRRWPKRRCAGGGCRGWWKSCCLREREPCGDSS